MTVLARDRNRPVRIAYLRLRAADIRPNTVGRLLRSHSDEHRSKPKCDRDEPAPTVHLVPRALSYANSGQMRVAAKCTHNSSRHLKSKIAGYGKKCHRSIIWTQRTPMVRVQAIPRALCHHHSYRVYTKLTFAANEAINWLRRVGAWLSLDVSTENLLDSRGNRQRSKVLQSI